MATLVVFFGCAVALWSLGGWAALFAPTALAAETSAAPAPQVDDQVRVQITSPRQGQRVQGLVDIIGYAADLRSSSGSGLNERDVQIYMNDTAERNLLDYAFTGEASAEAAAALGARFADTGFRQTWATCAFPPGRYTLQVWVSSLVAPGARNYATVDIEVAPCAPGTVLYENRFDAQADGVLRLRADAQGGRSARGTTWIFADFAAAIDARCPQAGVDCRYGLMVREGPGPGDQSTNTLYAFRVNPGDGSFRLRYYPPGPDETRFDELIPDTPSPAIQRGTAVNRLGVVAQGDLLRLYVNGQQVGQVRDPQRPWGRIGWVVGSEATTRTIEAQFDNFIIAVPGPPETLGFLQPGAASGAPAAAPAPAVPAAPVSAPNAPRNPILARLWADVERAEAMLRGGDCQGGANEFARLAREADALRDNPRSLLASGQSVDQLTAELRALLERAQQVVPLVERCAT